MNAIVGVIMGLLVAALIANSSFYEAVDRGWTERDDKIYILKFDCNKADDWCRARHGIPDDKAE